MKNNIIIKNNIENEFDEEIIFFHNESVFSLFEEKKNKINEINDYFPFLITQEFAFGKFSQINNDKYLFSQKSSISSEESLNIILSRIKDFSNSNAKMDFKLSFLNNILFYMENLSIEKISNHLIPCLSKIVDDSFSIQLNFLKINVDLIKKLNKNKEIGYKLIINNILTILNELFTINHLNFKEIENLMFENYLKLGSILKEKDLIDFLLEKIKLISSKKENFIRSKLIIKLISNLCEFLAENDNEKFIIPQIKNLILNNNNEIKIEIIKIFPFLCKKISYEKIENEINILITNLLEKNDEKINLEIIKILCDLMNIFQQRSFFNKNMSNKFYIEIFKNMIFNKNKKIRFEIFKIIGNFIYLLKKDELDNLYLNLYISIINEYYFNKNDFLLETDDSILIPAVFNFPAIVFRYGKNSWENLKKIYVNFSKEKDEKILNSLILSFNEISNILGEEITEKDLLIIYDNFLNNENENIRKKSKENLIKILKNKNIKIKRKYLNLFKNIFKAEIEIENNFNNNFNENNFNFNKINFKGPKYKNWRNKIIESKIIKCFFNIFNTKIIYFVTLPKVIELCCDDYKKVKEKSAKCLAKILLFLFNFNEFKENVIKILKCFSYNFSFFSRCEFCKISEYLLINYDLFNDYLNEIYFILAKDKIINVRIALANVVNNIFSKKKHFDKKNVLNDEKFLKLSKILLNDNENSVKNIFNKNKEKINLILNEKKIDFNNENYFYIFNNKMNFIKNEFYNISLPMELNNNNLNLNSNENENNSNEKIEDYLKIKKKKKKNKII